MGDFRVRKIQDAQDRRKMVQFALHDIEAFERMIREKMFDPGPPKIGAEQELCIVDQGADPATSALQLLDLIDDEHYTNELALYNLEINLDPLPFTGNCLSQMEKSLLAMMEKGMAQAATLNHQLLMTGILPTLKYRHLQFKYMTPVQRYQTLSQALFDIRGANFEIYLQGVDELIMSLGSVLFEACNTSFQLHLQIAPEEFVERHNWSQMIAGPVLSACVNSPLLFGNELWAETRIALFKQSLDTRSSHKYLRKKLPRVYFGNDWLRESASELWKNDLMRFPMLVSSDDFQDARTVLERGEIPDLRAIRLHNGTTYTWNRLCYGFSKKRPHLRIECRYLPGGPTAVDEIANFAFWLGLMNSVPPGDPFWNLVDFKVAKDNFIKAARTGLNSVFDWFGEKLPAQKLILEKLLPLAHQGLSQQGLSEKDIAYYLGIIEKRVSAETTGAEWHVRNFRRLADRHGESIAEKELVHAMLHYQKKNTPLYQWEDVHNGIHQSETSEPTVEQLMSTDIFSIQLDDSIDLARSILQWKNIHHLPVEDQNGNLVGIITDGMMDRLPEKTGCFARDLMLTDLITVEPHDSIQLAESTMRDYQLSGLPVVYRQKLLGILTQRDLKKGKQKEPPQIVRKK